MAIPRHKKFNPLPHFLVWGILLSLSIVMFSYKTAGSSQDIRGRAQEDPNSPGSAAWCADHCNPSPATNPCNQSESYKFADCCNEIAKTGDPLACGWPDRGYCLDSQCASIPSDVNRQRCGGPKHVWCDSCTSNGCPGYGSAPQPTQPPPPPTAYIPPPTSVPIPTVFIPPTETLLPTVVVTVAVPTSPPSYVTVVIQPTIMVLPTSPPPTLTPAPTPRKISLPQILPPKEKVQTFWESLKARVVSFLTNILP